MRGLIPGLGLLQPILYEIRARATLTSAAAVLGLVGLFALAAGLAAVAAIWLPWWAALLITAFVFLLAAAVTLRAGLHKDTGRKDAAEAALRMLERMIVNFDRR